MPTYDKIPAALIEVFRDPFPFPTPAPLPPSDIDYARPIPKEIQEILASVRLITSTSEDKGKGKSTEVPVPPPSPSPPSPLPLAAPMVASSSSCSFNQASPSTHELPQVKKIDPYEEGKKKNCCGLINIIVGSPSLLIFFS